MLSKNHWVRPFFVFFRIVREILFVTVALDHPVVVEGVVVVAAAVVVALVLLGKAGLHRSGHR